jgi:hypothetical protein
VEVSGVGALDRLEALRKRPGEWIGGCRPEGAALHLHLDSGRGAGRLGAEKILGLVVLTSVG